MAEDKKNKKARQHSYSSTAEFENCPLKFKELRLLGNFKSEDTHPAAAKGLKLHRLFEDALADDVNVGEDYQWVMDYVRGYTGLKIPEQKLAVDESFKPCEWFADKTFYRAILDVMVINDKHVDLFDYKTGRFRPKPRQIQEQALMAWFHFPHLETATARLIWTDADHAPTTLSFNKARDAERMIDELLEIPAQIRTAFEKDDFPATPNPLCGWCEVFSCRHNTKARA